MLPTHILKTCATLFKYYFLGLIFCLMQNHKQTAIHGTWSLVYVRVLFSEEMIYLERVHWDIDQGEKHQELVLVHHELAFIDLITHIHVFYLFTWSISVSKEYLKMIELAPFQFSCFATTVWNNGAKKADPYFGNCAGFAHDVHI